VVDDDDDDDDDDEADDDERICKEISSKTKYSGMIF
jgi:hypothetical protein